MQTHLVLISYIQQNWPILAMYDTYRNTFYKYGMNKNIFVFPT